MTTASPRLEPDSRPYMSGDAKPAIRIVEDDHSSLEVLTAFVESLGYPVVDAVSGEDAMRMLDAHEEIRLVLCDVNLPNMSGLEVLERTRASRPNIKVALV